SRHLVHREQTAGHIHHLTQRGTERDVYAVIVAGREIHGREASTAERCRTRGIATEQSGQRERFALRLKQRVVLNVAKSAEYAVSRAHDAVGNIGNRTRAVTQRTREEGVEAGIRRWVLLHRLAHVRLIAAHEPGDE